MNLEQKQKLFDDVVGPLLQQGERSMDGAGKSCRYRGTRSRKCAMGFLIPDALYTEDFEGITILSVLQNYPAVNEHFKTTYGLEYPYRDLDFSYIKIAKYYPELEWLGQIQSVHDELLPDDWREEFKTIAEDAGLEFRF